MTLAKLLRMFVVLAACALCVAASACHSGIPDGPGNNCNPICPYTDVLPPSNGVAQFSYLPVTPGPGESLTPLGSLNPPGHTIPTDHVYLYGGDLSTNNPFGTVARDVHMPATGSVIQVLAGTNTTESKVVFRATTNFYFYLDHIVTTVPIAMGDTIQAGTLIGTTIPGNTVDLGAFDASVTLTGFVTPDRYPYETIHAVSPWKYFTSALQPQIYAQLYRSPTAPDKDGKIDFDVAGTLSGAWFVQGMPADSSYEPYGWPRTLEFAYDFYDPTQVRIANGGTVGPAGVWAIDSTAPKPVNVTTANGIVAYPLINQFDGGPPQGYLLVQMVTASQIMVELFMGVATKPAQFDAGAMTYIR